MIITKAQIQKVLMQTLHQLLKVTILAHAYNREEFTTCIRTLEYNKKK